MKNLLNKCKIDTYESTMGGMNKTNKAKILIEKILMYFIFFILPTLIIVNVIYFIGNVIYKNLKIILYSKIVVK